MIKKETLKTKISKPNWLRVKLPVGSEYRKVRKTVSIEEIEKSEEIENTDMNDSISEENIEQIENDNLQDSTSEDKIEESDKES